MRIRKRNVRTFLYFVLLLVVAAVMKNRIETEKIAENENTEVQEDMNANEQDKQNVIKEFESRFSEEETEILFLNVAEVGGAVVLSDDILNPSAEFAASVDLAAGEFSGEHGRVEWIMEKSSKQDRSWGYDFEPYKVYHIRGRKRIPVEIGENTSPTINNCYYITELIDDGKTDSRLEELAEELSKPVLIEDAEIGTFTLDRHFSWFEGSVSFCGHEVSVHLNTDEDYGDTAEKSFGYLKNMLENAGKLDESIREQLADEYTELANEWADFDEDYEDDDNDETSAQSISREDFRDSLFCDELIIDPDGEATMYYTDENDVFMGHAIEVTIDRDGKVTDSALVG